MGRDGAGDKLRAAIVIHETAHFVGDNPDSATEWEALYDTLTAEQAITNPSTRDADQRLLFAVASGRTAT